MKARNEGQGRCRWKMPTRKPRCSLLATTTSRDVKVVVVPVMDQ